MKESLALEALVKAALEEEAPTGSSLVAYSGGPDSTALLGLLAKAGLSGLRAVYVDHGLRPEEELTQEFALVRGNCLALGVPLTRARVRRGAIEALAAARGEGLEAAARAYRHAALAHEARRWKAQRIFLAHTRDDQVETILMRALSGASAQGLGGIRPKAGLLRRPLLGVAKADLLAWLAAKGLLYSVDSTNAQGDFARNRLRQVVLPALAKAWPGWEGGLLRTGQKAAAEALALEAQAEGLGFVPQPDGSLLAPLALLSAPGAIRESLFLAAGATLLGKARLSSRLAQAALGVLDSGGGAYRGGGLLAEARPEGLKLRATLDFPHRGGYFVRIDDPGPGSRLVCAGPLELRVEWVGDSGSSGIRESAFSFPLVLRSSRPGDALPIPGGRKTVDTLLAEWGLAADLRCRVPVVEDRRGIVAVLGRAWGGKDRFRPFSGGEGDRLLSFQLKGA